ncbi:hypothetical protein D9613_011073 [Agrocybe pediades]|uniref:SnoaL-like domain-containing protein n=1 Tax=Agrocybe pediades TaxID=84607 RepID=A0A8H4VJL9_9AGAR|nr:hypothetical protein D9613_011073 [Agrocybe pediades]KAF9563817.1 hypothetical protein CPC08DRAFT_705733 [Agrocybe pediades]
MSTEDSRRIVEEWAMNLNAGKFDELLAMAAPDATWWVAGPKLDEQKYPNLTQLSGEHPYSIRPAQIKAAFGKASSARFTVRDIIAEGGKAVLELEPCVEGLPGKGTYRNNAMLKFVIRDGKIQEVREYLDLHNFFSSEGINPYP